MALLTRKEKLSSPLILLSIVLSMESTHETEQGWIPFTLVSSTDLALEYSFSHKKLLSLETPFEPS